MIRAQQFATRALSEVLRRQPLSDAKVSFAWQTSVGTAMACATTARLRADGTLDVRASNEHWRREVVRSTGVIRARLRELLGRDAVKRVAVIAGRRS